MCINCFKTRGAIFHEMPQRLSFIHIQFWLSCYLGRNAIESSLRSGMYGWRSKQLQKIIIQIWNLLPFFLSFGRIINDCKVKRERTFPFEGIFLMRLEKFAYFKAILMTEGIINWLPLRKKNSFPMLPDSRYWYCIKILWLEHAIDF